MTSSDLTTDELGGGESMSQDHGSVGSKPILPVVSPADREPVGRPRFGDLIENGWASERNPTRIGYFVREGRRTGRMNAGRYFEVTDGKGKFWELSPFGEHKITVRRAEEALRPHFGNVLNGYAFGAYTQGEAVDKLFSLINKPILSAVEGSRSASISTGSSSATTELKA